MAINKTIHECARDGSVAVIQGRASMGAGYSLNGGAIILKLKKLSRSPFRPARGTMLLVSSTKI